MKKLFATILLVWTVGALFGFAGLAEAQELPAPNALTETEITEILLRSPIESEQMLRNDTANADFYRQTYLGQNPTPAAGAGGQPTSPTVGGQNTPSGKPPVVKACFPTIGFGGGGIGFEFDMKECIAQAMNLVLWIVARLLWLAGVLLNFTLQYTLNLNTLLERLPIVDIGWKIIRDIANVVFIFIALWAGISITLGLGDNGKKAWGLLAHMVLVALFINFSLFITKSIVDASNVAALHFYSLIGGGGANNLDGGLSSSFMQGLRLQTLWNTSPSANITNTSVLQAASQGASDGLSWSNIILIGVFGSFVMVVAAWVFFAAAIMFIYRAITLIFLMILSPLAFVGWILPGASGMVHEWWNKLWSQALFAPLYLALAYIVVSVINNPAYQNWMNGGGTFAATITGESSLNTATLFFNFIILIGLMVGCLVIAQSLGAKGSEMGMAGWEGLKKIGMEGVSLAGRTGVRMFHFSEDGRVDKLGRATARRMGFDQSKGVGKFLSTLGGREIGIRKLDEVMEKSRFGQTALGSLIRKQTTGRLAEAKFGGSKSAQEAYEEHEMMVSRRKDIEYGAGAKEGAEKAANARKELASAKRKMKTSKTDVETIKNAGGASAFVAQYEAARNRPGAAPPTEEETRRYKLAVQYRSNPADIDKEVTESESGVTKWTRTLVEEKNKISYALAQMTTEGFLNQQKTFFEKPEIMDIEVLGADKYNALMASEHFTNTEKKEYTKARLHRIHEEQRPLEEKRAAWLKDLEVWQKEKTEWNGKRKNIYESQIHKTYLKKFDDEIETLQQNLSKAQKRHEQAEQSGDSAAATREKTLINNIETNLADRARKKSEYVETKIRPDEIKAGLVDASGKSTLREQPKPPSWDDDGIRKALRNITDTREILNYYRYDRPLIDFDHFVATVKQGLWIRVRESPEVDSETKEQFRVTKRYYIKEAGDLQFGLDPTQMNEFEKEDKTAAFKLRGDLNKMMKELHAEGYRNTFLASDDGLKKFLRERGLERLATTPAGQQGRHDTGVTMYVAVAPNLAIDEFEMMPGALRNLYPTWNHLDRATIAPFERRDIEDTLPMVNFFIRQFKKELESGGKQKISDGNLQILNWIVNEDRGQRFTQLSQIDAELKDTFETIKGFCATSGRALLSAYKNKEDLQRAIDGMTKRPGFRINPFKRVGFEGRLKY